MPCFELFLRQDEATQAMILGGGLRVGIEAAVSLGWDRVLGLSGLFIGMSGFGASGPYEKLYRHFGITAEAVAGAVLRRLGRDPSE
jgi:transketolase